MTRVRYIRLFFSLRFPCSGSTGVGHYSSLSESQILSKIGDLERIVQNQRVVIEDLLGENARLTKSVSDSHDWCTEQTHTLAVRAWNTDDLQQRFDKLRRASVVVLRRLAEGRDTIMKYEKERWSYIYGALDEDFLSENGRVDRYKRELMEIDSIDDLIHTQNRIISEMTGEPPAVCQLKEHVVDVIRAAEEFVNRKGRDQILLSQ